MFPAERGKVLEQGLVDALVSVAEVVCGSFEVDGVPEHDGCGEKVQSAGAVALLFKPARERVGFGCYARSGAVPGREASYQAAQSLGWIEGLPMR